MIGINRKDKQPQQTKVVTQTIEKDKGQVQIIEIEKPVIVYQDRVKEVKIPSPIKGIEFQNLHKDVRAIPESINTLKNYFDKTNATQNVARLELTFDKVQRALLEKLNNVQVELIRVTNNDSNEVQNIKRLIETVKKSIDTIKLDNHDKTQTIIDRAIFPITEKITRMQNLTEVMSSIEAVNHLVMELFEQGNQRNEEFQSLSKQLDEQVNKGVKVDPELKAYYTMFAEKIRDLEYIVNKLKANEETSLGLINRYNGYIDELDKRTKNIEESLTSTMDTVKAKIDQIQLKTDMVNKSTIEQINFVSTFVDLPDPSGYVSTKMFVSHTTFYNYKLKRKGFYVSTGKEWVRV